jgi:hypothetical protein
MDDTDIILSIINDGLSKLESFELENEERSRYTIMYFKENDMFPNSFQRYCDYVFTSSCIKDWDILLEYAPEEDNNLILTILSQLFIESKNYDFFKKCNILASIVDNERITRLLCNDYIWNVGDGNRIEKFSILGILFDGIDIGNILWRKQIMAVHKVFFQLVRRKELRPYIIKWFAAVFNYNITKKNMTLNLKTENLSSDYFLANVFGLIMYFWNMGVINKKDKKSLRLPQIDKVNHKYIKSKQCPIKWYTKDDNINITNPKFLSELFFLLLNGLRVVYMPILRRANTWDNLLEKLEKEKQLIENSGPHLLAQVGLMTIYKEIDFVKKHIPIFSKIVSDKCLMIWVDHFTQHFVAWFMRKGINTYSYDESFDDVVSFQMFIMDEDWADEDKPIFDSYFANLVISLAESDLYSKNPQIRFKSSVLDSN